MLLLGILALFPRSMELSMLGRIAMMSLNQKNLVGIISYSFSLSLLVYAYIDCSQHDHPIQGFVDFDGLHETLWLLDCLFVGTTQRYIDVGASYRLGIYCRHLRGVSLMDSERFSFPHIMFKYL